MVEYNILSASDSERRFFQRFMDTHKKRPVWSAGWQSHRVAVVGSHNMSLFIKFVIR